VDKSKGSRNENKGHKQNQKEKPKAKQTGRQPLDPRRCTKTTDSKKIDGVQYWWCPDHFKEGEYNGLYMPHRPGAEHDAWAAKKKEQAERRKQERSKARGNFKKGNKNDKSFVLNDKLKAALCTQTQMSGEELDKFLQQDFQ